MPKMALFRSKKGMKGAVFVDLALSPHMKRSYLLREAFPKPTKNVPKPVSNMDRMQDSSQGIKYPCRASVGIKNEVNE